MVNALLVLQDVLLGQGHQKLFVLQMLHYFLQSRGCVYLDALNELALRRIFLRYKDFLGPEALGLHDHGEHAGNLANAPI